MNKIHIWHISGKVNQVKEKSTNNWDEKENNSKCYIYGKDKMIERTSGQDGGVGKHGLSLRTTTSKLQLKYRTTIAQKCQKTSWVEVQQL